MALVKSELLVGKVQTGPCGRCEQCCNYAVEQPCSYDVLVHAVSVEAVAAALKGSGWFVQRGSTPLYVLLGCHADANQCCVIKHGDLWDDAPQALQDALLEPIPCAARGSGCEGWLLASHGECWTCGTQRQ
jgi:hypothetical protein